MGNHERSKSLTSRFTKTPNPCFHIKLENHYVCFTLKKMGPTGCTETSLTNYSLRCVTSQKNKDLSHRPPSLTCLESALTSGINPFIPADVLWDSIILQRDYPHCRTYRHFHAMCRSRTRVPRARRMQDHRVPDALHLHWEVLQ